MGGAALAGPELTLVNWILAFLPILLLLLSILFLNWGAPKSGALAWITAMAIGIVVFKGDLQIMALANTKGMSLSLYVLLIIWGAVLLYNLVAEQGAIDVIGDTMTKVSKDRLLQCLLMSWCFAAFLQGIAGFGVPVAVVAPIMVVMGFTPAVAAASTLVGHCWSISFGSMGSSYYTIQLTTKIPGEMIGPWMAIMFLIPILTTGLAVAHIYGGVAAVKKAFPAIFVTSVVMGFACWLLNKIGAAQLATLVPGLLGCGAITLMARSKMYADTESTAGMIERKEALPMGFGLAFSPYLVLIAISISSQIGPIKKFFSPYSWSLPFPELTTGLGYVVKAEKGYSSINILSHPAPLLFFAAIAAIIIFGAAGKWRPGSFAKAFKNTVTQCVPTSYGIATMVMMALIMNDTGMTDVLAHGLAKATGAVFPIFSPYIGVLGTFLTGSNTNSNVMFGQLQYATAQSLGISTIIICAAQSVGGSLGSSIAPSKVLIGSATVGLEGRESEVMKRTIPYCLAIVLLVGISTWLLASYWFPYVNP